MDLTQMRARVRQDLRDTDPDTYLWSDDEIDVAIHRALREYSLACPIEEQTDIPTREGDTELDISSLAGIIGIESVEFPLGESPPNLQHFRYWAGRLFMSDCGDGSDARVRWRKRHTLTADQSTIPEEHEELIVMGATAYLAHSLAVYTVDRATIAGRYATVNYQNWAQERLDLFHGKLKALSRRIATRELYGEEG